MSSRPSNEWQHSSCCIEEINKTITELTELPHITKGSIEHKYLRHVSYLKEELEKLQQWVNDLQAGMYINCVYCGHRYGPNNEVPATMAEVLKEHIEVCPKHPMSALKTELEKIKKADKRLLDLITTRWKGEKKRI